MREAQKAQIDQPYLVLTRTYIATLISTEQGNLERRADPTTSEPAYAKPDKRRA